jgi:hypothetical protein
MARIPIPQEKLARIGKLTNLIFTLAIVQEGYIKEVEAILRRYNKFSFEYKHNVNAIRKHAELLRAVIHKEDKDHSEDFGEDADDIEQMIKELFSKNNIEL